MPAQHLAMLILRAITFALAVFATPGLASDAAVKLIEQAKAENDAGNPAAAITSLKMALELPGLSPELSAISLGQMATAYNALGDTDREISALASALGFAPNDAWLLMRSCMAHTQGRYFFKAERDCARVETLLRRSRYVDESQTLETYLLYARAKLALAQGREAEALERLDEIPTRFLDSWLSLLQGRAYLNLNRPVEALEALNLALASDAAPTLLAELHYYRGLARVSLGDIEPGLSDLDVASTTIDNYLRSFEATHEERAEMIAGYSDRLAEYDYANCAIALQNDHNEIALSTCSDLSDRFPNIAAYHDARGLALSKAGRKDEARDAFSEALRIEPGNGISELHLETLANDP